MVIDLFRYPVKSMGGERLSEAAVGTGGIDGDRAWALIDVETGRVVSAKYPARWGSVLHIHAHIDGDELVLELPDGTRVPRSKADDVISRALGRRVVLTDRVPAHAQLERTDPVFEALLTQNRIRLGPVQSSEFGAAAPGRFVDYGPIHFVTTATLAALGRPREASRFRPNIVIDVDVRPFAENDLVGSRWRVGPEVVLGVDLPTPRCVVPTLAQAGLVDDPSVLRDVAHLNRVRLGERPYPCVGAYATVVVAGPVRLGDAVSQV